MEDRCWSRMGRLGPVWAALAVGALALAEPARACGPYHPADEDFAQVLAQQGVRAAASWLAYCATAEPHDALPPQRRRWAELLREQGPAALQALLELRREMLAQEQEQVLHCLELAIDLVAQQKDASWSGLYWYTDLNQAVAAARQSGRPILSLRLLGRLTDDLSCANSRFFRTVLYANEAVAAVLREGFVLHWSSERPVPVITIEFGDGRKLVRTITGNSVHYVLDARGRVVDALPGLWAPAAFRQQLEAAAELARATVELEGAARARAVARWHAERLAELDAAWQHEVARLGTSGRRAAAVLAPPAPPGPGAERPPASAAMRVAPTKRAVEMPLLVRIDPHPPGGAATDGPPWQQLAARYAEAARLDTRSRALMRRKCGPQVGVEQFRRQLEAFERHLAADTVHNRFRLHRAIHAWFAAGEVEQGLAALNARIYDQLFLTPRSDRWLGLLPADAYAALDGGGVILPPAPAPPR